MQKSRKIASSTSSPLTSPVIDPSADAAAIISTATISGGISDSADVARVLERLQRHRKRIAMPLARDRDLIVGRCRGRSDQCTDRSCQFGAQRRSFSEIDRRERKHRHRQRRAREDHQPMIAAGRSRLFRIAIPGRLAVEAESRRGRRRRADATNRTSRSAGPRRAPSEACARFQSSPRRRSIRGHRPCR